MKEHFLDRLYNLWLKKSGSTYDDMKVHIEAEIHDMIREIQGDKEGGIYEGRH